MNVKTNDKVVVKVLKPIRFKKICRECKVLENLKNGPNIIRLLSIVKDPPSNQISLIFEYVSNIRHNILYPLLTDMEIRFYCYELLKAIDYAHSCGIIHRDIKPQNVMIDHRRRKLRLIDWGLAEFYFPDAAYNCRVASRYYKAPELLVNYEYYDYSLDMWSFGCLIGAMVLHAEPMFKGEDNTDQLTKIVDVLGTRDFEEYIQKYGIKNNYFKINQDKVDRLNLEKHYSPHRASRMCRDAIQLINHLLRYDHSERLNAQQAMQHKFFKPLFVNGRSTMVSDTEGGDRFIDSKSQENLPNPSSNSANKIKPNIGTRSVGRKHSDGCIAKSNVISNT